MTMDDKLYELLMKLPRKNLISVMMQALDEMQAWNGRTRLHCICIALGCEEKMQNDGSQSYKVPSLKEIKENTDCFL